MNKPMSTRLRLCRIAILLLPLLFGALPAMGQVSGEYFWNADPGIGRASKMTNNGEADGYRSFTMDATGLKPGMNMLGMRAFSGGRWTHTIYSLVMIEADPKATAWSGEYFWDTDPGVGKATPMPAGSFAGGTVVADLDADGLAAGTHTLGMRVNAGGAWSQTRTYIVAVPAEPMAADWKAEYFWDTDPGVGKATPLPASLGANGGMIDVDVLAEGLAPGQHTIGFRTCSGRAWSPTVTSIVVVPDERSAEITGAEYFWGTDPGFGKGTPIAVKGGTEAQVELKDIDFPATEAEEYVLSFRARSPQGWGTTITRVIPHLYVESIALTAESALVPVGSKVKINSEITPADAFKPELTWTSSDASVATVARDGTVTGIAPGTVTITATSTDGTNVSGSIELTVLVPVTAITLSHSELTLEVSRTATLDVTVAPAGATNKAVTWSIEGDNCIKVSDKGVVTATALGEATVVVTAADMYGACAECHVKVVPLRGDADGSGSLAVNDVVLTARGVVGDIDRKLVFDAVDMNGDKALTAGDLTGVVGAVLAYTTPASQAAKVRAYGDDLRFGGVTLAADGMNVLVMPEDYTRYCGIQFDVAVADGLSMAGATSGEHAVAMASLGGATRVLSYATTPYGNAADEAVASIRLEAADMTAPGEYEVVLTNVMASDAEGNLYSLGDCSITVAYDPMSGLQTVGDSGLKISVEGHTVTIVSPTDTVVTLTDMAGINRRIEIKAGTNTTTVERDGVYIIEDRKIIIR